MWFLKHASFMSSYLKKRRQRVQINNLFRSLKEVIDGAPQCSKDGPFPFNAFVVYLFLFLCFRTLSNYVDDNNLSTTGNSIDIQLVNQILLSDFRTVNNWFYEKYMILNPGKCHLKAIGKGTHDEVITLSSKIKIKRKY